MITVAFLVQRIGPYHHARLRAWAALRMQAIQVVEFRPGDAVYAWAPMRDDGSYGRSQVNTGEELHQRLESLQPQVVVCVGYADREISQAMTWALERHIPLVTCSDSTFSDEPRSWLKERLKRRMVAAFASALVAGSRARDYMTGLGLEAQRQFQPWDVVDNAYFANGAERSRSDAVALRAGLNLPRRYFLCVARFVPKKNLLHLLKAYARYVSRAGADAWSLVLSGSGPQEAELRDSVVTSGLAALVHFPGFVQYPDLPTYYGLASGFVLPSVSDQWGLVVNEAMAAGLPVLVSAHCGCSSDLVCEGENGFVFAPEVVGALAACMERIAALPVAQLTAMGRRSREIVAAFSPVAFASGLNAAVSCALAGRGERRPWLTRLLVASLARRTPPRS